MMSEPKISASRILIVTGMSGAGKSSALKTLEDLGYEAVDNMPVSLLARLLALPREERLGGGERPLAIGVDARMRAFNAETIIDQLKVLQQDGQADILMLFLDCSGEELARRFSETRRRHPLALDRPVKDGIARERELLAPFRRWAHVTLDTTDDSVHQLRRTLTQMFALERSASMTMTFMSFGFARGVPRDADMMFDMRFLRNPHWDDALRPLTGLEPAVGRYVAEDESYDGALTRIVDLLRFLVPRYQQEGKSYLTVAFGCTGGKHRSVFVAEQAAAVFLHDGFNLSVVHRDLRVQTHGEDEPRGGVVGL